MTGHGRTRRRISLGIWLLLSAALHALFVVTVLLGRPPDGAFAMRDPTVWLEAVAPPPPPAPPQPAPIVKPQPAKIRRTSPPLKTPATTKTEPITAEPQEPNAGGQEAIPVSETGTLAVAADGAGQGTGEGTGTGTGEGSGDGAGVEPQGSEAVRKAGPAQLSIWLAPAELVHMALVRPTLGMLMSAPGYRDALRGSGIRPFEDLERLRIQLGGLAPEQLTVAGVHLRGEKALLDIAAQTAAMRNRELIWRGDSELRATSWIDGSGVERGLAVHAGAFVIGARSAMPALLGESNAPKRVTAMSQMRENVVLLLTIEDAGRYVPRLKPCEAQALRLSVAERGDGYRLSLTAQYKTASFASQARSCLQGESASGAAVSRLTDWLARAQAAPGSSSASFQVEVISADVQQLLDELAWVLRGA